jgi:hypothetical protein
MDEEEPTFLLLLLPKAEESLVSQHNKSVLVFVNRLRRGRSCSLDDGMVLDTIWLMMAIACFVDVSCFLSRSVAVCVSDTVEFDEKLTLSCCRYRKS